MNSRARSLTLAVAAVALSSVSGCGSHAPAPTNDLGNIAVNAPSKEGAPTITWKISPPNEYDDSGGAFVTSGLPAIASDGSAVLIASEGEDGGRGEPNLTLLVLGRDGNEIEHLVVLEPDDLGPEYAEGKPPTAEAMAEAKALLERTHQERNWKTFVLTATDEYESPTKRIVNGIEIDFSGHELLLKLPSGVVSAGTWYKEYTFSDCTNTGYLNDVLLDVEHKLALVTISFRDSDICDVDSEYRVLTW